MLLPVAEARKRIVSALAPLCPENVPVTDAHGRILLNDITAKLSNPPATMSAMDGYAVKGSDVKTQAARLECIGTVHAGSRFDRMVESGQCVRIFTGAPLPPGTDTVIIQENTEHTEDQKIISCVSETIGRWTRQLGQDFKAGDVLLTAGHKLSATDLALLAAAGITTVTVTRKPRIGLLSTGDELVEIGQVPGPGQIIATNAIMLKSLMENSGAEVIDLGIAKDSTEEINHALTQTTDLDMLVTTGGASVGDKDLIRKVFLERGMELDFWRVASRPGKPLMFGTLGDMPVIGLPGNPVSCAICYFIYLMAALNRLQGCTQEEALKLPLITAKLGCGLPENDCREDFMRATITYDENAQIIITPFEKQDSAMLHCLAQADALLIRPANAGKARKGDIVKALPLNGIVSKSI